MTMWGKTQHVIIGLLGAALLLPGAAVLAGHATVDVEDGASWSFVNGQATGSFVSFQLTDQGIVDYELEGQPVFASVVYDPALHADRIEAQDVRFRADGGNGSLEVTDSPAGEIRASPSGDTVTLTLADGASATALDERTARIQAPGVNGTLEAASSLSIAEDTIIAGDGFDFQAGSDTEEGDDAPANDTDQEDGSEDSQSGDGDATEGADDGANTTEDDGQAGTNTTLSVFEDHVSGDHVRFQVTADGLANLTLDGTPLISSLHIDPALEIERVRTEGDTFRIEAANGELRVQDDADLRFEARHQAGTFTLTPAENVTLHPADEGAVLLRAPGNLTGVLRGEELTFQGSTLTAQDELRFEVQGAHEPDDGDDDEEDKADHDDEDEDEDEDEDRDGDRGDDGRQTRRAFRGDFQASEQGLDGVHVSFQLADGGVVDYRVSNRTIFSAIAFEPRLDPDEVEAEGAAFEAESDRAEFKALDNPTGHFRAQAEDGTVRLMLAEGWNATVLAEDRSGFGNERVLLEGPDGAQAYVNGRRGLSVGNGTIEGSKEVRFLLHAPGQRGIQNSEVDDAIASGQVVGEVVVSKKDGQPQALPIENGPVNLTVETAKGNVTITVEGHGEGRTLLFNVQRDAIGRAEDMVVRFDGRVIGQAEDLEDVLNVTEGEGPEYVLIVGQNATQVLVQIPHFSVHTVQLQSSGSPIPVSVPEGLQGSLAVFGLAVVGTVVFAAATWSIRSRQR